MSTAPESPKSKIDATAGVKPPPTGASAAQNENMPPTPEVRLNGRRASSLRGVPSTGPDGSDGWGSHFWVTLVDPQVRALLSWPSACVSTRSGFRPARDVLGRSPITANSHSPASTDGTGLVAHADVSLCHSADIACPWLQPSSSIERLSCICHTFETYAFERPYPAPVNCR
ncbi:hypothetical protein BD413DRAFT_91107 [Trametes elegans]|nr:hypothetical protein BD413DRAFT_91107 [Trametes elegans]